MGTPIHMISLEHSYGVAALISAAILLACTKGLRPYHFMTLVVGLMLVGLAAIAASTFSSFMSIATALSVRQTMSPFALSEATRINGVWVLIFPAAVVSAGVNLVTSWLQSSAPPKEERDFIGNALRAQADARFKAREKRKRRTRWLTKKGKSVH